MGRTATQAAVRLVLAGFAAWARPAAAQSPEPTPVRVGLYQNEPKLFLDAEGVAQGIFPDLLREVAERESWQLVFVPGTWQDCLERLRRAEIDLMPDVCFTEERAAEFTFNRIPVIADWFGVFALHGTPIRSLPDIEGHRVAVLSGSVQETLFARLIQGFGLQAELLPTPDYDAGARAVRDGRASAMICNRYATQRLRHQYGMVDTAVIFNPTKLHVAAPGPAQRPLLDALDRHLAAWKEDPDSVYYHALKKHAGESPEPYVPRWLRVASLGLGLGLVLAAIIVLWLRWEVARRTAELRKRTRELEAALCSLRDAQAMALQQERLHALGQMTSGVAHDFNNVLMPVIGFSELLLDRPESRQDPNRVKECLTVIAEAGRDGQRIVARMRDFYQRRRESPACTRVFPASILRQVKDLTQPRWENMAQRRGIVITVKLDADDVPPILADETELREALVNLVFNAVDAMPDGGTLTLAACADEETVRLTVRDTGVGMPADIQARCFNAFYTTKGESGTGMGLPMVKVICDKFAGRIEMNSQPGAGTSFSMVFPALREPGGRARAGGEGVVAIRPLHILAVDDEPRALDVLAAILAADGHRVECVEDPSQALRRIGETRYDLVISDLVMPGLSGMQLYYRVMKQAPGLPFIILTGAVEGERGFDLPSDSACPILEKPLRRQALAAVLRELGFGRDMGSA